MKRWLLLVLALLAALVLVVLAVGWSLPERHTAVRSITVPAPPAAVFALVSSVGEYPQWRAGVTAVDIVAADDAGRPLRFREHGPDGEILFEIVERVPDARLVIRIADPSLPFGGRWTYVITPAGDGATLQITEDGEVYSPIFRFVSRFILGHTRTIDNYLRDVEAKLG